ncbi:MAG: hemerythrin domain-containing protein [Betaproteobacteria bacterium]|jgi:hemerythrin-like domain-containing protein|nr:hemerythrin domain-containing protein [Betaproteobacteria bacterium]
MTPQQQAIAVIQGEHRAMSAVIEALRHVADEIASHDLEPDYKMLWSILYYVDQYPESHHHPNEERVLFPRIRARTHAIDATLDELGRQHAGSRPHLDVLRNLLGRMEADIAGAREAFAAKAREYADFHLRHMGLEEREVLPKAREVLDDADWTAIAAQFNAEPDPLRSAAVNGNAWFREFYRRLVALVPEPWGVGSRR